ncbi:MAG: LytTR family DNA-binding domain-containing protein [Bacteroidota bacterium]
MKIAIIDDESKARELTRNILATHCPEDEVVGEAAGVTEGLQLLTQTSPDLLVLDVEMPDGTGFDLLRKLPQMDFQVVFLTAYEQYAIHAFQFSALDYLLKPLTGERMEAAVEKARHRVESEQHEVRLRTLLANLNARPKNRKIVLKTLESIHVVPTSDIMHCKSDRNYTIFFLQNGKKIMVSRLIKEYEKMLEPENFLRIHQSHLINMDFLEAFLKKEDVVRLRDGSKIPVASRKRETLMRAIEGLV